MLNGRDFSPCLGQESIDLSPYSHQGTLLLFACFENSCYVQNTRSTLPADQHSKAVEKEKYGVIHSFYHLRSSDGANMNEFADELRASRETKRISLTDISSATKIQLKYLRAMEEGDFTFLPAPYIRAFIRDYATAIQIDPEVTVARYEASTKVPGKSVGGPQPEYRDNEQITLVRYDIPNHTAEISLPHRLPFRDLLTNQLSKKKWLPIAALILLMAVAVFVAIVTRNGRKEQVSETPFEQVLKEKERASSDRSSSIGASKVPSTTSSTLGDSLILEGRTSQDVWVRFVIDDGPPKEYLFGPKAVRTWKAKESFRVSLGNAGGITFRLNGKDLGSLGKAGAVVRSALITHKGLQK
jgi:cytoskeletal protein RodZ